jgi:hypothetical protein
MPYTHILMTVNAKGRICRELNEWPAYVGMGAWVEGEGNVTILFIPCIILNIAPYSVIFCCNLCIMEVSWCEEICVIRLEVSKNGVVLV